MPRLPIKYYCRRHHRLRELWLEHRVVYALLSPAEQRFLPAFYAPHLELDDIGLRARRRGVVVRQPSLPHRAGKAFGKLVNLLEAVDEARRGAVVPVPPPEPYARDRPFVIRSVIRSEPDLAKLLILMAQHLAEQAREERERPAG